MKALLEKNISLNDKVRSKKAAQPKWEDMDDVVQREARGLIKRWKRTAEGEAKAASLGETSLEHVAKLRANAGLNTTLLSVERTTDEGTDGGALNTEVVPQWNRVTKEGRGEMLQLLSTSKRPPRIAERRTFPSCLESPLLNPDRKRSGIRWVLYWFPV